MASIRAAHKRRTLILRSGLYSLPPLCVNSNPACCQQQNLFAVDDKERRYATRIASRGDEARFRPKPNPLPFQKVAAI